MKHTLVPSKSSFRLPNCNSHFALNKLASTTLSFPQKTTDLERREGIPANLTKQPMLQNQGKPMCQAYDRSVGNLRRQAKRLAYFGRLQELILKQTIPDALRQMPLNK
ncbi:hypothetical protein M9H77_30804 [Catharanthus roseus]|uniref:Uncharacterized protein n=1 Tax=Catharanthus roseus TaxID=4058 RepID=A0ACB9ZZK8_CATRO|nr:hypothetical protein M9H77_30804 [Catharanthus roseus]